MLADDKNTKKHLEYINNVIQFMGYNLELIVNVLETAKNFLVRLTSFCVPSSGFFISPL